MFSAGLAAFHWIMNLIAACSVAIALLSTTLTVQAATPSAAPQTAEQPNNPPPRVGELLDILADPAVQSWLQRQRAAASAAASTEPVTDEHGVIAGQLANRVAAIRSHLGALAAAFPQLPVELAHAVTTLRADFHERGLFEVTLLIAGFVALGCGLEWLFSRLLAGARTHIEELRVDTVGARLHVIAMRFVHGASHVIVFALGSVGAFLVFDWPPLFREVVLAYLQAFVVLRLALVLGRFLFAPGGADFGDGEETRIVPMGAAAARFWYRRVAIAVGWFAFGLVTVELLGELGVSRPARQLVAYGLGIGLLGIALDIAWRRPPAMAGGTAAPVGIHRFGHGFQRLLLTLYFVALWLLWVASAMPAFWFGVLAVAVPTVITVTQRSLEHIMRPPGSLDSSGAVPSVLVICLKRGARAALLIGAALILARVLQIDVVELTARDTLATRILQGALSAVVIVLLADFAWQVIKALIDRTLAETKDLGAPNTDEARRRARLQTLLPIVRNVVFITVIVATAMMALSALGVQIGPLVAGAGVVGVAIGFGAQTLVRDIISGMFYFLDDAFRVGEYIQSGTYKGTVESFSLRSVKLRHHRGPLYTVPFGVLGAVQNMSRDWVIDKLTVGVTYDTDLERVRKLIKQIGKELAEDPELAPHFLEPLKMQGVEQFGDFAIQIRMKMMTRPGEQFVIRRRAYAMIKKAFDANGIKFAFPTVQVAGGEEPSAASAAVGQAGLALIKAPTPAE